jgi:hypothetical protein
MTIKTKFSEVFGAPVLRVHLSAKSAGGKTYDAECTLEGDAILAPLLYIRSAQKCMVTDWLIDQAVKDGGPGVAALVDKANDISLPYCERRKALKQVGQLITATEDRLAKPPDTGV